MKRKRISSNKKIVVIRKRKVPLSAVKNRPKSNNSFKAIVLHDMNKLLPPQPFKVGIDKDLFHALKKRYPGQRSRLRHTIKFHLRHKTAGRHYLRAMLEKPYRNGLDGERYKITIEHKRFSKRKLAQVLENKKKGLDKKLKRKT